MVSISSICIGILAAAAVPGMAEMLHLYPARVQKGLRGTKLLLGTPCSLPGTPTQKGARQGYTSCHQHPNGPSPPLAHMGFVHPHAPHPYPWEDGKLKPWEPFLQPWCPLSAAPMPRELAATSRLFVGQQWEPQGRDGARWSAGNHWLAGSSGVKGPGWHTDRHRRGEGSVAACGGM